MDKVTGRVMNLLGLCGKAGKTGSGEFQCEEAIRSGRARLVLLAADASENTRKRFCDRSQYYHVPVRHMEVTKGRAGGRRWGRENAPAPPFAKKDWLP